MYSFFVIEFSLIAHEPTYQNVLTFIKRRSNMLFHVKIKNVLASPGMNDLGLFLYLKYRNVNHLDMNDH